MTLLAGGLVWIRHALLVRRRRDENTSSRSAAPVPAALRRHGAAWIVFTTPMCASCSAVEQLLRANRPDETVVLVDASRDPELAARWDIKRAPTTLYASADGTVTARLVGVDAVRSALGIDVADPI